MSRGGARPAKSYLDPPEGFVLRLVTEGDHGLRAGERFDSWPAARFRILELLRRPYARFVAVADDRDARVVLVRYYPGETPPAWGPDPVLSHPVWALLERAPFGHIAETKRRAFFDAIRPYLKDQDL